MKVYLLTAEYDRSTEPLGCYDSLVKAQGAAAKLSTKVLVWDTLVSPGNRYDVSSAGNIVSVAEGAVNYFFVVCEFLLNKITV